MQLQFIIKWLTVHLLLTDWVVQWIRCLPYNTEVPWFESSSRLSFSTSIIYTWRHWRHNLILIKILSYDNILSSVSILRHILLLSTILFSYVLMTPFIFLPLIYRNWNGYDIIGEKLISQRKKVGDSVIRNTLTNCAAFFYFLNIHVTSLTIQCDPHKIFSYDNNFSSSQSLIHVLLLATIFIYLLNNGLKQNHLRNA